MSESDFYDDWVADGKPWRNARPIAEILAKLKAARPEAAAAACFGSIGNLDHLLADPPQDHTPYSQTGWPLPHPYPRITAVDITHRPDLGVDCNLIHKHWLASANTGQIPWIKYWIWQGRRYDVRNNFNPVSASGHYDHLHGSQRTDHIESSIGGWHPLPGYGDDMANVNQADWDALIWRVEAIINNRPEVIGGPRKGEVNKLHEALKLGGVDPAALADELAPLLPAPPVPPSADEVADAVVAEIAS